MKNLKNKATGHITRISNDWADVTIETMKYNQYCYVSKGTLKSALNHIKKQQKRDWRNMVKAGKLKKKPKQQKGEMIPMSVEKPFKAPRTKEEKEKDKQAMHETFLHTSEKYRDACSKESSNTSKNKNQ